MIINTVDGFCGSGKTHHAKEYSIKEAIYGDQKTVIVQPSKDLINQTHNDAIEFNEKNKFGVKITRIDSSNSPYKVKKRIIAHLRDDYEGGEILFVTHAPNTRTVRRSILERFCQIHGGKRYSQMLPKHLMIFRDDMTDRPEAANSLIKALRQLFKYAISYGHADSNPAAQVGYLKSNNPDGFHAWTVEEIETFEATHPVGTKARLALAMLIYTGQRRGDVVTLGCQHLKDGWLKFTQQKTGKKMEIPVLTVLQNIIDASPTGDMTFIVSAFNKPFSAAGFGNRFRKWCDEAGLNGCSAHGLRKSAAARLANIGCTTHEIMAITGHDSLKELERYTRSAEQKRLAESAMRKAEA